MQPAERFAVHDRRLGPPRRRHRLVGGQIGEGVQAWLQRPDAGEQSAHHLDRRDLLVADHRGELHRRRKAYFLIGHGVSRLVPLHDDYDSLAGLG